MSKAVFLGYLRLMRPANLPTAAADIFAGAAISGGALLLESSTFWSSGLGMLLIWLLLSTVSLYAGGVVMNDVFDYELDKIERPERALPSGLISVKSAAIFGCILLLIGVLCAFMVSVVSGTIAVFLAIAILLYDGVSKKHAFIGPLNMGICRGLNLLLGMSLVTIYGIWWYSCIPILYIFAITLISRGEVHGDNKKHLVFAGLLYGLVITAVLLFSQFKGVPVFRTIPFLVLFGLAIYVPLVKAYRSNSPKNIKGAVIAGVLSLIILDAAIAIGYTNWLYGLLMLLLLALSFGLSKLFAVT